MAIAERFGDLSAAKHGLTRVLGLLDDLSNLIRRRTHDGVDSTQVRAACRAVYRTCTYEYPV